MKKKPQSKDQASGDNNSNKKSDEFYEAALLYHSTYPAGKLEILPTKPLATQLDLSLAYSPGVAEACRKIAKNPQDAAKYTNRANLVAVITNGTAVLGLGAIGALASKPVMEGKAILFRKFAGINAIDIEINEEDPDKLIDIINSLEPSFGGINLEDIKSPECFKVERTLKEKMNIPVFHDDQHGTAIIVAAAVMNGLTITKKKASDLKLVASGAGAAALSCLNLLVKLGVKTNNIRMFDATGEVVDSRENLDEDKAKYARSGKPETMKQALKGADMFLGLSAAGVLKGDDIKEMAKTPLIFALANPTPEILPEEVMKVRDDAIIATGRSDYPNQVNNVLCFPYLFRGALDCQASSINEDMKMAAVKAIAEIARRPHDPSSSLAYAGQSFAFGSDYIIPKPFDSRLIIEIASAVAEAAKASGVAGAPIKNIAEYREKLSHFVFRSGLVMKPVFDKARTNPQKVIFCEGEEERVIRAVRVTVEEGFVKPVLIGRKRVVEARLKKFAPSISMGQDIELIDPEDDHRYNEYWKLYHELMERKGVTPSIAKHTIHTQPTIIGALAMHRNEADAMICGVVGSYQSHLKMLKPLLPKEENASSFAAMMMLVIRNSETIFICDTHATEHTSPQEMAHMALMAANSVKSFGLEPKVAFLSHSNFGSSLSDSAKLMRNANQHFGKIAPDIIHDGEMHSDCALDEFIRSNIIEKSTLTGAANLLVMPSLDAANITYNTIKILSNAQAVGPVLLGSKFAAHIVTNSVTSRGLVNIAAIGVVQAQRKRELKNG